MSKRWANKMRTMYILVFLLILAGIATPTVYKKLNPSITCFDGIQNQGETAVDLGGPCFYRNSYDLKLLDTQWARSFMVVPGLYSAVTYVENPNPSAGARNMRYIFKLYDERNLLVAERLGTAFIPAGRVVPIFEGNLQVGGRVPVRTLFEFIDAPVWEAMESELAAGIIVADKELATVNGTPRVTAQVQNTGVYALTDLVVVATLFDEVGNAVGASRTKVPALAPSAEKKVTFTWPRQFDSFIARIDVVPLVPPVYLRK